jgi:hypothetical protein
LVSFIGKSTECLLQYRKKKKKIESDTISGSEVAEEMDILEYTMKSRRDKNFRTSKLISLLSDVEDFYSNDKFSEVANYFSNTFLLYLEKWSNTFHLLEVFRWVLLKNPLVWKEIQHSIKYIADVDQNIMKILDEDERFNKFSHITNIRKDK